MKRRVILEGFAKPDEWIERGSFGIQTKSIAEAMAKIQSKSFFRQSFCVWKAKIPRAV